MNRSSNARHDEDQEQGRAEIDGATLSIQRDDVFEGGGRVNCTGSFARVAGVAGSTVT